MAAETGIGLLRGAVLISSGTLVSTGASGTVAGKGSQVPAGTTTPPGGTVPSSYRHALSCACGVVGFETSLSYALPERHRGQAQENCKLHILLFPPPRKGTRRPVGHEVLPQAEAERPRIFCS